MPPSNSDRLPLAIAPQEAASGSVQQVVSNPVPIQVDADGTMLLEEPLESPRHLTWLLLRDRSDLNRQEQRMLAFIRQEPVIEVVYDLAQRFITMVRSR
jgi:hypothetical protein